MICSNGEKPLVVIPTLCSEVVAESPAAASLASPPLPVDRPIAPSPIDPKASKEEEELKLPAVNMKPIRMMPAKASTTRRRLRDAAGTVARGSDGLNAPSRARCAENILRHERPVVGAARGTGRRWEENGRRGPCLQKCKCSPGNRNRNKEKLKKKKGGSEARERRTRCPASFDDQLTMPPRLAKSLAR